MCDIRRRRAPSPGRHTPVVQHDFRALPRLSVLHLPRQKAFYPAAQSPSRSRSPPRSPADRFNQPSPTQLWQYLLLLQRGRPPTSWSPSIAEDSPEPPDDSLEYRIALGQPPQSEANNFLDEIIDNFLGQDRGLAPTVLESTPEPEPENAPLLYNIFTPRAAENSRGIEVDEGERRTPQPHNHQHPRPAHRRDEDQRRAGYD